MAQIISSPNKEKTTVIDEVNTNLTYIGTAKLGSSEDAAVWQIRKIEKIGAITRIHYADNDRRYDNVWLDRTELTYDN